MLKELVIKEVIKELLKATFNQCAKYLKNEACELTIKPDDFITHIEHFVTKTANWCSEIGIMDSKGAKHINSYVEIDLFTTPRFLTYEPSDEIDHLPLSEIFSGNNYSNYVLLGQPGSGKTTSIKHISNKMLHDSEFSECYKFLLVIRLRDLNIGYKPSGNKNYIPKSGSLFKHIADILGLRFKPNSNSPISDEQLSAVLEGVVSTTLNSLNALVLLDGFDEVIHQENRESVLLDFRSLCLGTRTSGILLTSRTGEFQYHIERAITLEISPLNKSQIKEFSQKWLGSNDQAELFLRQLHESPFSDTSIRPLNLAQLCAIFEKTGSIPEKPKTVYRRITDLLIKDWDEQRSVKRSSIYAGFEPDRKFDFLSHMAFKLALTQKQMRFSAATLEKIYKSICLNFSLPISESRLVAKEIESHTGLVIQSSSINYEFCHKSIQEYLAAEHLVRLPFIPGDTSILSILPNELAIATAISSDTSLYFSTLVLDRFKSMEPHREFISAYITRLIIEKPDFNYTHDVTIALLYLYSLYLFENDPDKGVQYRLYYDDSSSHEFDVLIAKISSLNHFSPVLENYHHVATHTSMSEFDVLELELNATSCSRYPTRLFCKSSLLPELISSATAGLTSPSTPPA